jgi:hypothetical protein
LAQRGILVQRSSTLEQQLWWCSMLAQRIILGPWCSKLE